VVQENPGMDYAPAEQFGDVRFITSREFRSVAGSFYNEMILAAIESAMVKFKPEHDYLVFTGNPAIIGYTFHLAYQRALESSGKEFRCLQWNRLRGEYYITTFPCRENRDEN
jgi:hypothetical protein